MAQCYPIDTSRYNFFRIGQYFGQRLDVIRKTLILPSKKGLNYIFRKYIFTKFCPIFGNSCLLWNEVIDRKAAGKTFVAGRHHHYWFLGQHIMKMKFQTVSRIKKKKKIATYYFSCILEWWLTSFCWHKTLKVKCVLGDFTWF